MAWGLWNKIKQGFKKVGAGIKKAVNWIGDKIVKPVTNGVIKPFKPLITAGLTAVNPVAGAIAGKAMDFAERWSDDGFDSAAKGWARKRFNE